MKRSLLVGLGLVCLVIYLVLQNGESVDFRLTRSWIVHWNVGALIGGAFVVGVLSTLLLVAVQAGQRAFREWRARREEKRRVRIEQWEDEGEQLIWDGDSQRGRALLQKAQNRRADSPRAALALAASFRDTGELHRARAVLLEASGQHKTDPNILLALAELHRSAGDSGASLETLERLRALHPRAPRALRALREDLTRAERWTDAANIQESYLAEIRDPQRAVEERGLLLLLRYLAALQIGDPSTRLTALEALTAGRNTSIPVAVSMGDCLVALDRRDEASAVWERALKTSPRSIFVERLSALATEAKHRDRIRNLLKRSRSSAAHPDRVHAATALLYLADRNPEEAERELQNLSEHQASDGALVRIRAELYRQRGQSDQALAALANPAAAQDSYDCRSCGRTSPEWRGYCPHCQAWDSYRSALEIGA